MLTARKPTLEALESRDCPSTLDLSGYASPVNVTLTATDAGGFSGNYSGGASGSFSGVDVIVGNGGDLTGASYVASWGITGDNAGTYSANAQTLSFSTIATLIGGAQADTFASTGDALFAGTIQGGVGTDTLDYSSHTTGRVYTVSASNGGDVGGNPFTSIEGVKTGAGDDTFLLLSAGRVTGAINAGGGTNLLDYTGRTSAVRVNLALGTATSTGGVSGFVNVTGGSGNDVLFGDGSANVLQGGDGNDILSGMGGDDALSGGDGRDLLFGGAGSDALDGGADDDIVVGDTTSYDSNISALAAIQLEWSRAGVDYATRTGRIFGTLSGGFNGSFHLNSTTISDDGAGDGLTGGDGQDWFFTSSGDALYDLQAGERQDVI